MSFDTLNEAVAQFVNAKESFEAAVAGKAAADQQLTDAAEVAKQKTEELSSADADAEEALSVLLLAAAEVGITLPVVVPPGPEPTE